MQVSLATVIVNINVSSKAAAGTRISAINFSNQERLPAADGYRQRLSGVGAIKHRSLSILGDDAPIGISPGPTSNILYEGDVGQSRGPDAYPAVRCRIHLAHLFPPVTAL